jgi:hypothetical protein
MPDCSTEDFLKKKYKNRKINCFSLYLIQKGYRKGYRKGYKKVDMFKNLCYNI